MGPISAMPYATMAATERQHKIRYKAKTSLETSHETTLVCRRRTSTSSEYSVFIFHRLTYLDSGLINLMKEAANTSETSVNFYQAIRRNIAKD
jgi:hypothetical protein